MHTVRFLWPHPRHMKRKRRDLTWWEMFLPIYQHRITSQTLFLLLWMIMERALKRIQTCSTQFHHSKPQAAKSLKRLKETVTTRVMELAVILRPPLSCARSRLKSLIANLALQTENRSSRTQTRMPNSQLSCHLNARTSKRMKYLSIEFKRWDLPQRAITDKISLLKSRVANLLEFLHVDQ